MQVIYLIGWKSANATNFVAQFIKADVLIDVGDHNFAIVGRFHFNFGITGIAVIHHLCRHLYLNFCKTHPQTNWKTESAGIALLNMQMSLYRQIFYFSVANLMFGTPMSYSNPLLWFCNKLSRFLTIVVGMRLWLSEIQINKNIINIKIIDFF